MVARDSDEEGRGTQGKPGGLAHGHSQCMCIYIYIYIMSVPRGAGLRGGAPAMQAGARLVEGSVPEFIDRVRVRHGMDAGVRIACQRLRGRGPDQSAQVWIQGCYLFFLGFGQSAAEIRERCYLNLYIYIYIYIFLAQACEEHGAGAAATFLPMGLARPGTSPVLEPLALRACPPARTRL